MSRTTIIILVALGAALAGFAFSSAAQRLRDDEPPADTSIAARPQSADLRWRETLGPEGEQLVFSVESLEVVPGGWRVKLSLENDSSVAYEIGDPRATLDRAFGLRLFSSNDTEEFKEQSASGALPAVRPATRYEPALPAVLEPGDSWKGTISASGALVAESWVRVVFGTLVAVGRAPDELPAAFVWTTDRAHRLRR